MGRTRVLRREQERPDGPHLARLKADAERARDVEPVAGEVLRLQRFGGNEAVESMLAQRAPKPAQDTKPAKDKEPAPSDAVSATIVLPDPIGVLPVISYSFGNRPPATVGGSGGSGTQRPSGDDEHQTTEEVHVTIPSTDQNAAVINACTSARGLGSVKLSTATISFTLKDVLIVSCVGGAGDEPSPLQLTLNATGVSIDLPDDKNQIGSPDTPGPPNYGTMGPP
jgi:hypothetical protein